MIPPIASRFVAGESAPEALEYARELDDEDGVGVILNLLGEHYHERGPADEDTEAYLDLVGDVAEVDGRVCISVKPSQLGLDVGADGGEPTEQGREVFRENLERIVERAREHDVFVWIDMEDHPTTDATLDAYEELVSEHDGGVGLCLQANLKRTSEDLDRLAGLPGKLRLVKGAYDEPGELAYKQKAKVNEAYRDLLAQAFEACESGVAVATHDDEMIEHAIDLHEEHGTDFEFQMLMGVREDRQAELAAEYEVWQYVPYGGKWLSYFYRRIMERKENLVFALRAIIGR